MQKTASSQNTHALVMCFLLGTLAWKRNTLGINKENTQEMPNNAVIVSATSTTLHVQFTQANTLTS